MTSKTPVNSRPVLHPQRQKLIIRKSCRKVKECSTRLAAGEIPSVEELDESAAALKAVHEVCTGTDQNESEREVATILGALPLFLGHVKGNLDNTIKKIEEGSPIGCDREQCKRALQDLLAISSEWQQLIQQRTDEALQTRKAWEEKNPIQAAQKHELSLYIQSLQPLLDAPSARAIHAKQWQEADTSLASLQVYLLDNKISAEQVRGGGERGIESVLRDVLKQMEEWDTEGLGFKKDDRVDLNLVEKIWGRADKIGSGLNYLLLLDARGDEVDGMRPTTRSVFLLKSGPPVHISFASSRDALLLKKLSESRERLVDIVLDPNKPDIKRDDEPRWNAAYRELEALEKLLKRDGEQVSQETIRESRIEEVIRRLCTKLESLHIPPKAGEDGSAFALMYASWELTVRIGASLGLLSEPALEGGGRTGAGQG
ncbi:hypothetical protein N0V82_005493 [Gnomoniopsis sp. IMI 355080]|nr:hypothetical protein N0V82_005493 [Gnomoniopsis sp. IMI 355080]